MARRPISAKSHIDTRGPPFPERPRRSDDSAAEDPLRPAERPSATVTPGACGSFPSPENPCEAETAVCQDWASGGAARESTKT